MSRYEGATREMATMLINMEAHNPTTVNTYLEHFGLTELPIPLLADNDSRQYRTWQLQPVFEEQGVVGYDYVKSHVPADRGGYLQALSNLERFDAEQPTDFYSLEERDAPKPKAKPNAKPKPSGADG